MVHASCGVGAIVDLQGEPQHQLVEDGFRVLVNLDHRGARGAEENTGDGAGMLLQTPDEFFRAEIRHLPERDGYGVAQLFLPRDERRSTRLRRLIETVVARERFELLVWRVVPTDASGLGQTAADSAPAVWQFFVAPSHPLPPGELDLRLYILRRGIEKSALDQGLRGKGRDLFYICSLGRRTIVYKGMLTCRQLRWFYPELADARIRTRFVLVHARFSTNTLGSWDLAHPHRVVIHNGEFNSLRGNLNWMRAHEPGLASPAFGDAIDRVRPVTADGLSDTEGFDHVLELLMLAGRTLPHALRMMVPEAWHNDPFMDAARRGFYAYHAALMEPWDGPALVIATDGERVAAILDRNGLRPCRYCLTRARQLIMASETGVLETPADQIILQGRLKPGELLLADTLHNRLVPEQEIFAGLTAGGRYARWTREQQVRLESLPARRPLPAPRAESPGELEIHQRAFGYTLETLRVLVQKMAESGMDPIGSMGDDAPLAVLSARDRPLFHYFSQQFAQVSNPPLDFIREALVTTLEAPIGRRRNLLAETPDHARQLLLASPVLTDAGLDAIDALADKPRNGIRARRIPITFDAGLSLREGIEALRGLCVTAIGDGVEILVLSDAGLGARRITIPSLLAIGAVHHHLIRQGLRDHAALVLHSGEPCAVHHVCTLIGYGADAIHPWLAYRSVARLAATGGALAVQEAVGRYRHALESGILKVMAKMGISTLPGYKGAQIFECIGLQQELVDEFFTGTSASIPALGLDQIEREARQRLANAYAVRIAGNLPLDPGGEFYWRRDGERHHWNPYTIGKLQQAARNADCSAYRDFAAWHNDQDERLQNLRGLLDFRSGCPSIAPDQVEPAAAILRRFSTGSMSFGALSREAHEVLAEAMNRIGGMSGTGEGGEQTERFGSVRECSMKQVASGRFGVTAEYLARARQIEIKMAQGSKPGEGGELPGAKVDEGIASVRFTVPGVGLISPPPHHDIYSIEDLAQLIHDLKCASPGARIHVKLVARAGVGTIAAGVAKCRADAILISGNSGGTGASMKTSIKGAGGCWELGVAETQRVLMANGLRSRITLRTDGGLLTGRDVVIAALLGAEEYGFGTAPLVALGCIMLRKCHCNTCSVGVATQDPELRRRFGGAAEHVVNYLRFVAEEARELMARLGVRCVQDLIGRSDLLVARPIVHPRGLQVDISELLARPASTDTPYRTREQNHQLERKIDHRLLVEAQPALEHGLPVALSVTIRNRDRTFGTLLSHELVRRRGAAGLPAETIRIRCAGTAGQSFGAFVCRGISLDLEGDANDYLGKGLSGGRISVRTPANAGYDAAQHVIAGNVALYGATAGEAYVNGLAGERFAVRNSGALAVVEGVGDHGCEYMTGGVVVILGRVGRNFAAGMSGGEAYVHDEAHDLHRRVNPELVRVTAVDDPRDHALLRRMIENHVAYTRSAKARQLLDRWQHCVSDFVKVIPDAYAAIIEQRMLRGEDIRIPAPPRAPRSTAA